MSLLEVDGVTKHFGGVAANEDVSFTVEEGELVGIIGPNGAGKTTLFDHITGFSAPDTGRIIFDGRDITGNRPDRICAAGLARTFQIVRVFPELTVLDNVVIGALHRHKNVSVAQEKTHAVLERVGLEDRANALGRELPIAARKRVQLARALATEPRMVFLDEAMAGLNKKEARAAVELLKSLRQEVTIVMTEHVMEILMPLSDRVIVLVEGKKLVEGPPNEVSTDKRVVAAYLGEKFVASGE